ncbi:hypothetical protein PG987_003854 [Apiospora arundinis]
MAAVTSTRPQQLPPLDSAARSSSESPRSSNTSNEKVDALAPTLGLAPSNKKSSPWKTFRASFKHLWNLTPKEVDDFMDSYVIYNLDWENEKEMIDALGPDYQQRVGACLKSYYGALWAM